MQLAIGEVAASITYARASLKALLLDSPHASKSIHLSETIHSAMARFSSSVNFFANEGMRDSSP